MEKNDKGIAIALRLLSDLCPITRGHIADISRHPFTRRLLSSMTKFLTRFAWPVAAGAVLLAVTAALATTHASTVEHAGDPARAALVSVRGQQHVTGLVTGVADGDTCYVMIDGKSTRVRLAQIDAPEKTQPFGRRAEQSLRELVGKRNAMLTWSEIDRYGRPVVQVLVNGVDVNAEQVARGYAWVYRRYSSDAALLDLENAARKARRGLWADAHPVSPWVWRRMRASKKAAEPARGDHDALLLRRGLPTRVFVQPLILK